LLNSGSGEVMCCRPWASLARPLETVTAGQYCSGEDYKLWC
jgi:hypothetical protein